MQGWVCEKKTFSHTLEWNVRQEEGVFKKKIIKPFELTPFWYLPTVPCTQFCRNVILLILRAGMNLPETVKSSTHTEDPLHSRCGGMRCLRAPEGTLSKSLWLRKQDGGMEQTLRRTRPCFHPPSVMLVIPKVFNHYRIPYEYTILNSVRLETSQS